MAALCAALVGCASGGPPTHLYSLMPADIAARDAAAAASAAIPVALELRLPSQVDQPQWLVRLADDSLVSLEQERWASPLRDEVRQALFEELGAKSGVVDARNAAKPLPVQVAIDVRRFDSIAGREARIEGSWTLVIGASDAASRCEWLYREAAPGAVSALAQAHRKAIVRLADAIGANVVAASRGQPLTCPVSDLR